MQEDIPEHASQVYQGLYLGENLKYAGVMPSCES